MRAISARQLLTVVVALLAAIGPLDAARAQQERPYSIYASVDLGRHQVITTWPLFDPDSSTATGTSSALVGLRLGGELGQIPWLRTEMGVSVIPFASTAGGRNTALLYDAAAVYVAHGLAGELLDTMFTPVADVGLGGYHNLRGDLGRDLDLAAHIGVGLRGQLSERFALRISIRDYFSDYISGSGPGNNVEATVGLEMVVLGPVRPYTPKPRVDVVATAPALATTDADGDTIIDGIDRCPDEPEDHDGYQDTDGCPEEDSGQWRARRLPSGFQGGLASEDEPPAKVEPPQALFKSVSGDTTFAACRADAAGVVRCPGVPVIDHIVIYFEPDTTAVTVESLPQMRHVARLLTSFTEVEHVWIEGHADERDSEDYNRALSIKRAQEVREYLVRAGVAAGRVTATGFSATQPVTTLTTEEAKALNQRVEFRIAPREDERGSVLSTPGKGQEKGQKKGQKQGRKKRP